MATCAVLHVVAAAASPHASGLHVLAMLGMALACLPCATHVLLHPTRRTWIQVGVMSVGMLVAHPLLGLSDAGHAGHMDMSVPAPVAVGLVLTPALAACCAGLNLSVGSRQPEG